MKTYLFILVMLALASCAQAADIKKPASTSVCKFSIHAGNINQIFSCAAGVEAYDVDEGIVHADLSRGADRYLLIEHSNMSRPGNPNGQCGGGVERYLVWLHVRGSRVLAAQSAHFESCWQDIEGEEISICSPQRCSVEYAKFTYDPQTEQGNFVSYVASFDFKAPEKGLHIVGPKPVVIK